MSLPFIIAFSVSSPESIHPFHSRVSYGWNFILVLVISMFDKASVKHQSHYVTKYRLFKRSRACNSTVKRKLYKIYIYVYNKLADKQAFKLTSRNYTGSRLTAYQ